MYILTEFIVRRVLSFALLGLHRPKLISLNLQTQELHADDLCTKTKRPANVEQFGLYNYFSVIGGY